MRPDLEAIKDNRNSARWSDVSHVITAERIDDIDALLAYIDELERQVAALETVTKAAKDYRALVNIGADTSDYETVYRAALALDAALAELEKVRDE